MEDYLTILTFFKDALFGFFAISVPLGNNFPLTFGHVFGGIIGLTIFIKILKFIFGFGHHNK